MILYTLSFDHRITKGDDAIHYYKWVRVSPHQVSPGTTNFMQYPEHLKPGEIYEFMIEDTGTILGYVEQNRTIRTLTSQEKETYASRGQETADS